MGKISWVRQTEIPLALTRQELANLRSQYDEQFQVVFEAIKQLMTPPERARRKIGFDIKEPQAGYGKRANRKKSGGKLARK